MSSYFIPAEITVAAGEGVLDVEAEFLTKFVIFAVGGVGVRGFVTTVARAPVTLVAVKIENQMNFYSNFS